MVKRGHIPIRMCIGCGGRRSKWELIRFVKKSDGSVMKDQKCNLPGRGFYICPDIHCFKKAQKKVKEISLLDPFEMEYQENLLIEHLMRRRKNGED